jgi:polyisoprenoid-binding protein YceI
MKKLVFLFLLLSTLIANAQTMVMNDTTTDVTFETRHLLGKLEGTLRGVSGTIFFDSVNLINSTIKLSFQTSTFVHNDQYLGPDLWKPACFDIKKYPTIDLRSTSITNTTLPNQYEFKGTLTVKDVAKNISFPFTAVPNVGGFDFDFSFPLNKNDFKLDCAFKNKMTIKVKGYGKRINPNP